MPNRIIKESLTTSTTLAGLDDGAERHFWRLLVQADDFGYIDAHPSVIRARAYPLMLPTVSEEESERRTLALVESGLLHLFTTEGKRYGHFPTWGKHQQKRAKYSKYPQVQSCDINCNHLLASAPEKREARSETLDIRSETLENSALSAPIDITEVKQEKPTTLKEWQALGLAGENRGQKVAVILDMLKIHWKGTLENDPGGRAAALLQESDDIQYVLKVLWECIGASPAGDILLYTKAAMRNKRERIQRGESKPRRPSFTAEDNNPERFKGEW